MTETAAEEDIMTDEAAEEEEDQELQLDKPVPGGTIWMTVETMVVDSEADRETVAEEDTMTEEVAEDMMIEEEAEDMMTDEAAEEDTTTETEAEEDITTDEAATTDRWTPEEAEEDTTETTEMVDETVDDQPHEATAIHSNDEVKNPQAVSKVLPKILDYPRLPVVDLPSPADHPRIGPKKQRQMRDSKLNFSLEQTPVSTSTNTTISQLKRPEKTFQNISPTFSPQTSEKSLITISLDLVTLYQHLYRSTLFRLFTEAVTLWLVLKPVPVKLLLFYSQFWPIFSIKDRVTVRG